MPKIYGYTEILGDILVTGSFSVLGSASVINTTNLVVSDTIISLGHSQSGSPVLDEGIMFGRGTGLTQAFIWDETNDTFALVGTNDDHTVVGSVNIDSYSSLRTGGIHITNTTTNDSFLVEDSVGDSTPFVIDSDGKVGIGTTTPQYKFEVSSPTGSFWINESSYGLDVRIYGTAAGVPQFSVNIPPYLTNPAAVLAIGMRTWDDTSYSGYGKVGDAFVRAGNDTNGLNIINTNGTGTEDYIRFYAGTIFTSTPDLHIHGTGTTRGFIGIGVTGPNYRLEVSGTVSTTGFRMTSGANSGYVLTSDASGNATWQATSNAVNIYSSTQSFSKGVTYSINHALNTNNVIINVWNELTGDLLILSTIRTGLNTIDLYSTEDFSSARIVIMGG